MLKGSIPALITPFKNGEIDWKAFENLIEFQIENGSHGLVPCGTTGESPTLSHKEHREVIKRCIDVANKRVPVIAGAGSNSTAEAIELTKYAKEDGADYTLHAMPYYNKPTQTGMIAHFTELNKVGIPIIIYNIPGRSVVDMSVETMTHLAQLPNIVGVKDATGDAERPIFTRIACGEDFINLSGEDAAIGAFYGQGGHGIISVVANIAPKISSDLFKAWESRDLDEFARLRDLLAPVSAAMFCETNPAPIKYAASLLGLCTDEVRLPMVKPSEASQTLIRHAMKTAGIL